MTIVRKNLRIKMINSSEPSSYVVRSLVDRVLSQSIMNKSTQFPSLTRFTLSIEKKKKQKKEESTVKCCILIRYG